MQRARSAAHFPAAEEGSTLRETPRIALPNLGDSTDRTRQLELSVLKFISQRRALARELSASPTWPPQMQALWLDLISRLDLTLAGEERLPPRVLIQARVSSEVERDLTERRYGPCPEAICDRLSRSFARISDQLRGGKVIEKKRANPEMIWPINPVIITSGFGHRRDPISDDIRFHAGIDLSGRSGDLVEASGKGRVIHSGWLGGYGRAVIVQHPGGYQSVYGHLSQVLVPLDAEVDGGSPLGFLGSSGRSTGPHLHFEIRRDGVPIDPHEIIGLQWMGLIGAAE